MGKNEGKKLADGDAVGAALSVEVVVAVVVDIVDAPGAVGVASVVEGFSFTGRSTWSVGAGGGSVLLMPVSILTVATTASSMLWSSSCSSGSGWSDWDDPSIASPHRFSRQSINTPVYSLTSVSLTITVHLPMPDSPL